MNKVVQSKMGYLAISFLIGLTYLSQDHIFFWDTIQFAGKHGQWFFDQHFRSLLLPDSIDSGHPPVFGWYLALIWMIFGKSLVVSHWAMLPFLIGIVWQLLRLGRLCLHNLPPYSFLLIVLVDPVFLGQSILVSPDMVLIFFFFLAVSSLWEDKQWMLALACVGLTAVSTRGMMIVSALGLYQLFRNWRRLKKIDWKLWWSTFSIYLPAAIFSLLFLWIHFRQTGWFGYHADSPWAPNFERVGIRGFFRNLVIFAWRWLDYGRVFLWLLGAYLVYQHRKTIFIKKWGKEAASLASNGQTQKHLQVPLLWLSLTLLLSISFLLYRGLHAHRYLLPAFLIFSLTCLISVDRLHHARLRRRLLPVILLALLTGNSWIYPERIAQGWDATLAHWPYYSLREELLDYLKKEQIPLDEIGTAFPDIGPFNDRDLSGRSVGFKEKSLQTDEYILYSNIMNDFSDAEILELQTGWEIVDHFENRGVFLTLYRKP